MLLAIGLMVAALIAIIIIIIQGYSNSKTSLVPDQIYTAPVNRVQDLSRKIEHQLAKHIDLGNLDLLYQDRVIPQHKPKPQQKKVQSTKPKPTNPHRPETSEIQMLHLTGIAWSQQKPIAFINGDGLTVGETVAGWKIVEITANSVRLKNSGGQTRQIMIYSKTKKLQIKNNKVKSPPSKAINL